MRETAIMRAIRRELNATRRVRLVRNNVGFDTEHRIPYGLGRGSADLVGMLRGGVSFAIEVKTPEGRMSPEQRAWWRAYRAWGGQGGVARTVPEALVLLEEAERHG